jgi:hypothetical protein
VTGAVIEVFEDAASLPPVTVTVEALLNASS